MRNEIVEKAIEYLGYKEGPNNDTIFGDWYGLPNQPWCAMFISYIANEVGIPEDIIPKFASCTAGFRWFEEQGIGIRENLVPNTGDIIFFVWNNPEEPTPDHVGIVEKVDNGRVYTIEGNRSDKVQRFSYDINSWQIYGYALPNYEEEPQPEPQPEPQEEVIAIVTVEVDSLLRVRQGPSTEYPKVGEFYNDDTVELYQIEGNWGRCDKGWICLDYTNYQAEEPSSEYVLGLYVVNTPSGLNVRSFPVDGNIVKAYPNGTRFDTYEIENNWALTPSGWVCLDYCDLIRIY